MPGPSQQTDEVGVLLTAAAQTAQAVQTTTPGLPSTALPTLTGAPTLTPPAGNTPLPVASSTSTCNVMKFIDDLTIPDGSILAPGQNFTKTWRLRNDGTCTWTPSYAVVFSNGSSMSGPATQALVGNTNPGQLLDLSMNLTAPAAAGDYTGYYKLRDAGGTLFGQFYVQIKVQAPGSSGFDLHTRATEAEWKSAAGNLSFGGPDTDTDGFVMYRNGSLLEDGTSPSKVLEMHPQWVNNGVITGLYPEYTVVAGDSFTAKIGFLAKGDGTCGVGNVTFQLNYREAGVLHALDSWTDSCDGDMSNVQVNLDSLAGHTVRFALAVLAGSDSMQDWAVWVRPQVGQ